MWSCSTAANTSLLVGKDVRIYDNFSHINIYLDKGNKTIEWFLIVFKAGRYFQNEIAKIKMTFVLFNNISIRPTISINFVEINIF